MELTIHNRITCIIASALLLLICILMPYPEYIIKLDKTLPHITYIYKPNTNFSPNLITKRGQGQNSTSFSLIWSHQITLHYNACIRIFVAEHLWRRWRRRRVLILIRIWIWIRICILHGVPGEVVVMLISCSLVKRRKERKNHM